MGKEKGRRGNGGRVVRGGEWAGQGRTGVEEEGRREGSCSVPQESVSACPPILRSRTPLSPPI